MTACQIDEFCAAFNEGLEAGKEGVVPHDWLVPNSLFQELYEGLVRCILAFNYFL